MSRFAAGPSSHTSTSPTVILPEVGRSRPLTIDSVVVLPAPLGPTKPVNDPARTSTDTSLAATSVP